MNDKKRPYVDYSLIFIVIFLLGFGLIMVYSTSSYEASMSNATQHDAAFYLKKQLFATMVGILVMMFAAFVPYKIYARFSVIGYGVAVALVMLVLTPLGMEINGARRWLNLGLSVQPAEIAKLALIIFSASMICSMGNSIVTRKGFLVVLAPTGIMCLLVWQITDNMSSALIIGAIAMVMLFVATPGYKRFAIIFGAGAALVAILYVAIVSAADSGRFGFRGARILAWRNPEAYASGKGFQTLQALYAIGSGGLFGKGLGQSIQKQGFVPEAQNDMIFSIICEELGIFGGICIIFLFALLLWRLLIIANNADDLFGALLVIGVIGHISVQVVLNIAVVTNTIPNTGISLPFISYGGSSVMFLLMEIGICLNVARKIEF